MQAQVESFLLGRIESDVWQVGGHIPRRLRGEELWA